MNFGHLAKAKAGRIFAAALLLTGLIANPITAAGAAAATAANRPQAPRYAAILVDAKTHEILYSTSADEPRHPASITKIMTLYLAFDALSAGRLSLNDPVVISKHAVSQKPSRLGVGVGKSITVDQAIRVIAVKSANDIAVALAETIAGSEEQFVTLMNSKARMLGMRNTNYANASGLPDPTNVTTARDIALLSVALMQNHKREYSYFSLQGFSYGNQTFANHNRLLGKVFGVDGIKTGYTVDAGYTLAASAVRDGQRLIAVVLGEPSIAIRNRDVTQLLETGFTVLNSRPMERRLEVASLLPPEMHPAFRDGPRVEQGSRDEGAATKTLVADARPAAATTKKADTEKEKAEPAARSKAKEKIAARTSKKSVTSKSTKSASTEKSTKTSKRSKKTESATKSDTKKKTQTAKKSDTDKKGATAKKTETAKKSDDKAKSDSKTKSASAKKSDKTKKSETAEKRTAGGKTSAKQ